jgi:thiol-disulfide isomerase/thioredoxin
MNKYLIIGFTLIGSLIMTNSATAQTTIEVTADGIANDSCKIAYHYGSTQYIKKTFFVDAKGKAKVTMEETLEPGIYMFVFPDGNYREFLVTGENLKIHIDEKNSTLSFSKSKDNLVFSAFLKKVSALSSEMAELKANETDEAKIKKETTRLDKQIADYRLAVIKENKGSMVAGVLKSVLNLEVPESVPDEHKYIYLRKHYFDNIDLSAKWLVRTPIFAQRMDYCLDKLTVQQYDSVNATLDDLLQLTAQNEELFKFTLMTLVNRYAKSKRMDAVNMYVHLVQNYYRKGKATWTNKEQVDKMVINANRLEKSKLGIVGRNIQYLDTTKTALYGFSEITSDYLVLFFWDPDCDKCMEAAEKMKEVYQYYKSEGVEVLGLGWTDDKAMWKKAIKDNKYEWINGMPLDRAVTQLNYDIRATPKIFVLDKDRRIIARQIDVDGLKDILSYELKKEK